MASKGRPRWAAGLKIFAEFSHEASVNALALEPTERHIFYSGCGDEHVRVWDLRESGRDCKHRFEGGHTGYVSSLLLVDEYLMSASFDRTIVLWNTHRRDVVRRITAHAHAVNALCYHDCGALVSASWDGTVRLWDLRTNSSKGRGYAAAVQVGAAVLSCATHGADVFCGLHDHSVAAIDLRAGARRATFSGHTGYVTALEATGAHVLSASQDGTVRIIDTRTGAGRELLRTHAPCFSLYHRADGARRWIVSGHADGVIRLSDAISGETLTEYGAGGEAAGTVFSLVAWHDGLLVAGSSDGTVRCFGQRPCDRDTHAATALQTAWRGHSSRKAPPLSAPSSPKPRSPLSLDPLPQLDSETPLKDSLEGLSLAEQTPALAVESPATRAESPASSALESPASSAEAGVKGRIKGGGFVATEGVSQKLLRAMGRKSSTASRTATTAPPPEGAVSGASKGGKTAARAAAVESSRAAASAVSGRAQALR